MTNYLHQLKNAYQFFTRLPLPLGSPQSVSDRPGETLADASPAFPVIGILIGAICAFAWLLANAVLPSLPAAGLAIAISLLLTGALHEDGLADCSDALGGNHDKARILEIMRDSTIGTYGACALLLSIGLRWSALAVLDPVSGALVLIIAHSTSRAAIAIALRIASYARTTGLGSSVATGINITQLIITLGIALAISMISAGFSGLIASLVAFGAALAFLKYLQYRIGGYTGDGLGAMQQLAEISAVLVLAGLWA